MKIRSDRLSIAAAGFLLLTQTPALANHHTEGVNVQRGQRGNVRPDREFRVRQSRTGGNSLQRQSPTVSISPAASLGLLPTSLDLRSVRRSFEARVNSPVDIMSGGKNLTVTANSRLTAAQAVAVQQVLYTGSQAIELGANGNAVGGSVTVEGGQFSKLIVLQELP